MGDFAELPVPHKAAVPPAVAGVLYRRIGFARRRLFSPAHRARIGDLLAERPHERCPRTRGR